MFLTKLFITSKKIKRVYVNFTLIIQMVIWFKLIN